MEQAKQKKQLQKSLNSLGLDARIFIYYFAKPRTFG
jgi:hypothetical protein